MWNFTLKSLSEPNELLSHHTDPITKSLTLHSCQWWKSPYHCMMLNADQVWTAAKGNGDSFLKRIVLVDHLLKMPLYFFVIFSIFLNQFSAKKYGITRLKNLMHLGINVSWIYQRINNDEYFSKQIFAEEGFLKFK